MNESELLMPMCSEYVRTIFEKSSFSAGGRWLMINVTDKQILEDVKILLK